MGFIVGLFIGAAIGVVFCAIVTSGKISDLQDTIYRLRRENYKLNTTVK